MKARFILLTAVCLGLVSCIGDKNLRIYTEPEGASITINGKSYTGSTPMEIRISQKKDLAIVATKPNYQTAAYTLTTKPGFWSSLVWTKNDPRAQYIEENEVTLRLQPIPSSQGYRPQMIPENQAQRKAMSPPALRPMPKGLVP